MKKQTFVVRVMRDRTGRLIGQLSEPVEGWRRPFSSPEALWQLLEKGEETGEEEVGADDVNSSEGRSERE